MSAVFQLKPRYLLWIAVIALLVRFLFSAVDMKIWIDSQAYILSARALLECNWPGYYVERPPGYPFFLIPHILLAQLAGTGPAAESLLHNAVGVSQALLGTLTALLSADTAARLFKQQRLALFAGLLVALSPDILLFEHSVLTESLYGFSLMLCLWYWSRIAPAPSPGQLVAFGLLSGWQLWVRPLGLVFSLAAGWTVWQQRCNLRDLGAFVAPVLCVIALWTGFQIQAHQYFGYIPSGGLNQLYKTVDFIRMDTGLHRDFKQVLKQRATLYPDYQTYEAVNDVHILHAQAMKGQEPYYKTYLGDDQAARAISLEAMAAHPDRYLQVTLRELKHMLLEPNPWDPHLIYWLPVLLLAALGTLLLWLEPADGWQGRLIALAFWGQMLAYPLLTVVNGRYRVPLEPLAIILAVYAAAQVWRVVLEPSPDTRSAYRPPSLGTASDPEAS